MSQGPENSGRDVNCATMLQELNLRGYPSFFRVKKKVVK
jgi:hypothetical protein